jgi:hypothetical protein
VTNQHEPSLWDFHAPDYEIAVRPFAAAAKAKEAWRALGSAES